MAMGITLPISADKEFPKFLFASAAFGYRHVPSVYAFTTNQLQILT